MEYVVNIFYQTTYSVNSLLMNVKRNVTFRIRRKRIKPFSGYEIDEVRHNLPSGSGSLP